MRTVTTKLYSFDELSEEAQQNAIEREKSRREQYGEIPWQDETCESAIAVAKLFGDVVSYSLGAYNQNNHIKVSPGGHYETEVLELSGPRAIAWLENNVLQYLRAFWVGEDRERYRRHLKEQSKQFAACFAPGKIVAYLLTGYYTDQLFVEHAIKSINNGDTIGQAIQSIATLCGELLEEDHEQYLSEANIRKFLYHKSEEEYTENGDEF